MTSETVPAIIPRNLHFEFDKSLPLNWHSGDPLITAYFDALSLTFPIGERFFVDSVRHYAKDVTDPDLRRDVQAFMSQESIHGREHETYNELMAKRGFPVDRTQRIIGAMTRFMKRHLPHSQQLAATCALEHYTALFAEASLGTTDPFADAHPFYRDLWHWHAMEEEEHKAVAFDVFQTVVPGLRGYLIRCYSMVISSIMFNSMAVYLTLWIAAQRGELFNLRSWGRALWFHWVAPGAYPHVLMGVLRYFSPSFHPAKRHVAPEVLAWRNYYRQTVKRVPASPASIFEGLPGAA